MELNLSIADNKAVLYPLIIVGTAIACWILIKALRVLMTRRIKRASAILRVDPTRYSFLKNTVSVLIIGLGIAVVFNLIPELRKLALPIFAGAGVLAAVIGFASQQALSNIVGGIFIVIFRPFRVGDIIKIGQIHTGTVEDITLRHTIIRNFENKRIVIPNAIMNAEIIENAHLSDERVCIHLEIGISYSSSIDLAMEIMRNESEKHPLSIDPRTPSDIEDNIPRTPVRVISLNDSAVLLRAWVWANNPSEGFTLRCDLLKNIKHQFDSKGVEIPFPQRVVHLKN